MYFYHIHPHHPLLSTTQFLCTQRVNSSSTLAVAPLWPQDHYFCKLHSFPGALLEQHLHLLAPRKNSSVAVAMEALWILYVCKLQAFHCTGKGQSLATPPPSHGALLDAALP